MKTFIRQNALGIVKQFRRSLIRYVHAQMHRRYIFGKTLSVRATVGDYCIIHAGGWDHFKANSAMLCNLYGQMSTIAGIAGGLAIVFGVGKMFSVMSNGEKRDLNLDQMKDTAETIMQSLELMTGLDDTRGEIEGLGEIVIRLHEDLILLTKHIAVNAKKTAQELV